MIDGAVRIHNERKNRDIGYTPNDIWLNNNNNDILYMEKTEPSNMTARDTTPQFDVGDYVRVTRRPRILEKRSLTNKWSQDLIEVVDIDDHIMPLMYEVKNVESDSRQKCYDWELLASKCKPQPAPPVTRSKSRKETQCIERGSKVTSTHYEHPEEETRTTSLKCSKTIVMLFTPTRHTREWIFVNAEIV